MMMRSASPSRMCFSTTPSVLYVFGLGKGHRPQCIGRIRKRRGCIASASLEFLAAFQCPSERYFIGVFEVAADRQSARRSRDPYSQRRDEAVKVHRGGLSLQVRVRGEYNLRHLRAL